MDIIRTALLGATALSLSIGVAAAAPAGPNATRQSAQNHGAAVLPPKGGKAIVLSASVNADGSLAKGVGATASSSLSAGNFEVDFNRDVTACSYAATIGNATAGTAPAGFITDAARAGNPNGVFVQTLNTGGAATSIQFHLVVACPKG